MFVWSYCALKFEKKNHIPTFFFQFLNSKLGSLVSVQLLHSLFCIKFNIPSIELVLKILIRYHLFVWNYYALRFEQRSRFWPFQRFFQFLNSKLGSLMKWYAYQILQFAIVFLSFELVKKIILIAFAYQKWLHNEISQKCFEIKEFSFFRILL